MSLSSTRGAADREGVHVIRPRAPASTPRSETVRHFCGCAGRCRSYEFVVIWFEPRRSCPFWAPLNRCAFSGPLDPTDFARWTYPRIAVRGRLASRLLCNGRIGPGRVRDRTPRGARLFSGRGIGWFTSQLTEGFMALQSRRDIARSRFSRPSCCAWRTPAGPRHRRCLARMSTCWWRSTSRITTSPLAA